MLRGFARVAAWAAVPVFVVAGYAGAQTPQPSATPAAAPAAAAFSAHAHANVTVVTASGTYGGSAQLGVAQRANQTRIDLLSLRSDSIPVPPISVTVVIDRGANTLTAWSDTTKLYRVQPFLPGTRAGASPRPGATPTRRPTATPSPSATAAPRARGTSPFAKLDVLSATVKLTGHTTTAGLPTTGLSLDLQVQNRGDKAPTHISGTTQLADDYAVFPMTVDLSLEPGTAGFSAKLAYAVDDFTRGLPPAATFTVPAGYTEAPSLLGVIFPGRSPAGRMPAPSPSPRR
jgi:hypothetical protein